MLTMPVQVSQGEYALFVVLEDDNIVRMKEYDPAEVDLHKLGPPWNKLRLRTVIVGYLAPGEDTKEFHRLIGEGRPKAAIRYLNRGFRFRPERGDHDADYLPLRFKPGETKH
jgi:hypothetical protein